MYQRHQSHIRVCGDGNGAQQVGCELTGYIYCGRAIGPSNNADGRSFCDVKIEYAKTGKGKRAKQGSKYAKLRRRTQKKCLRVGEQWAEVGQRPHAHKYKKRENTRLNPHHVKLVQDAIANSDIYPGNIAEYSAKADRDQQQRFKASSNGEIEKQHANPDHRQLIQLQLVDPGTTP